MNETDIIDLIYRALQDRKGGGDPSFTDVSFDGDNDSCEVIITTEEGGHKEWVISSKAVRLLEDNK